MASNNDILLQTMNTHNIPQQTRNYFKHQADLNTACSATVMMNSNL